VWSNTGWNQERVCIMLATRHAIWQSLSFLSGDLYFALYAVFGVKMWEEEGSLKLLFLFMWKIFILFSTEQNYSNHITSRVRSCCICLIPGALPMSVFTVAATFIYFLSLGLLDWWSYVKCHLFLFLNDRNAGLWGYPTVCVCVCVLWSVWCLLVFEPADQVLQNNGMNAFL